MNLNIWFDIPSSNVNICVDLLGKFPALKNCRGGNSFFSLLSQTHLYISFNWSILVLIIITYSTCRESRDFCDVLFVKTQFVKCKVVYEAKENFVKNFWLTGNTDFSVFCTDMHQSIVNQMQLKVSLYSLLRLTKMNFSSTMSVPVCTWLQQEYKMATRQLKANLYLSFECHR